MAMGNIFYRLSPKPISPNGYRMCFIYGLTTRGYDPDIHGIRYIGKTMQSLYARLQSHLNEARRNNNGHAQRWINATIAKGGDISMHQLAIVPVEYAEAAEKKVIADWRLKGARLTNMTDGGEGTPGHRVSDEVRAKISKAQKGVKETFVASQEYRDRVAARDRLRWSQPGARERHGRLMKGRKSLHDPERYRKISLALTGRKLSNEHIEKIRLGSIGKRASEATKRRMSESQLKRYSNLDTRNVTSLAMTLWWAKRKKEEAQ